MSPAREKAVAALREIVAETAGIADVRARAVARMHDVLALSYTGVEFDEEDVLREFGLVAVDQSVVGRLNSSDPDVRVRARHELASVVEEQLGAKP